MLIPRVIPCLLVEGGSMVKTIKFKKRTYLGDPLNVINLFNRFEVDEIVLLDINASKNKNEPDFDLLENLADECWVPLTYGGGITKIKQVEKLILMGVEKVVIGTAAVKNLNFITEISKEFGTQCVVSSIDAKRKILGGYSCFVKSGKQNINTHPAIRAKQLEDAGAGEILLQSINQDGMMSGYDLNLIEEVTASTNLPVVACGGAGTREQISDPILKADASAAAAGSLFVFSGKERGVLINFPERDILEGLFS